MEIETIVGLAAAFFTTISYFPQVLKVWRTRETEDLSIKMLIALAVGLLLWIAYGIFRHDVMIILANAVSVSLVGILIAFKIRTLFGS
jgi:MtN3 and saliva related transmembrane protein